MLKLAFTYQDKLNQAWQSVVFQDKYQFYNFGSYWNYEVNLDKDSYNKIQMVSVDKNDKILGYLSATSAKRMWSGTWNGAGGKC